MFVVSPWSTGGWVTSETFDHTSVIRFIEKRFGVNEPQITPWRRAVAGDLTSAFDFGQQVGAVPTLPSTVGWEPTDTRRHADYKPTPPKRAKMPVQEAGTRPARAIGYNVQVREVATAGAITVDLVNGGTLGAHLQARLLTPAQAPHSYTVGAGAELRASWPVSGTYDIHLHGPNGFFRRFAGDTNANQVHVTLERDPGTQRVHVEVTAPRGTQVVVHDAHAGPVDVDPNSLRGTLDTTTSAGWYDLTVSVPGTSWLRTFAGHLETGAPSLSDPALGR
jgi:phospholipase C